MWKLINYMSFIQWLSVGMSIVGMLYMRYTKPHLPRPIRMPLVIPIVFLVCVLFLLVLPLYAEPYDTGMGILMLCTGVPVYYIGIVWESKPKAFKEFLSE